MPRLTDPWFDARFYGRVQTDGTFWLQCGPHGPPIPFVEAQGVSLWCPCGYGQLDEHGQERYPLDLSLNKGRPHWLLVPFLNGPGGPLPPDHGPHSRGHPETHPRWTVSGSGLQTLTVTPSIAVNEPECWHGWITEGDIRP